MGCSPAAGYGRAAPVGSAGLPLMLRRRTPLASKSAWSARPSRPTEISLPFQPATPAAQDCWRGVAACSRAITSAGPFAPDGPARALARSAPRSRAQAPPTAGRCWPAEHEAAEIASPRHRRVPSRAVRGPRPRQAEASASSSGRTSNHTHVPDGVGQAPQLSAIRSTSSKPQPPDSSPLERG